MEPTEFDINCDSLSLLKKIKTYKHLGFCRWLFSRMGFRFQTDICILSLTTDLMLMLITGTCRLLQQQPSK